MKFSIIVPVYNVEQYLEKCLNSIINQTFKDFELLVINDGTKDNSQKIIDEFINKYPNIVKGFIKENGGLSDARNYGVERAQGEYIVFIDSDDYINENLLEKLNDEIDKVNDIEVIGYNFVYVDEEYKEIKVIKKPQFSNIDGEHAINELVLSKTFFEPTWGFAYSKNIG